MGNKCRRKTAVQNTWHKFPPLRCNYRQGKMNAARSHAIVSSDM